MFVSHPHTGAHAGADDDLRIDHAVEHFATQSTLLVCVEKSRTQHRLNLLAAARVEPLEVVVADFGIVDGCDRDAAVRRHVLMNAPKREGNADENHDSHAIQPVALSRINWSMRSTSAVRAPPGHRDTTCGTCTRLTTIRMWADCAHIRAWDGNAGTRRTKENAPAGRGRVVTVYLMAEWTGLEPATPGVTGRYSNQLNYHSE